MHMIICVYIKICGCFLIVVCFQVFHRMLVQKNILVAIATENRSIEASYKVIYIYNIYIYNLQSYAYCFVLGLHKFL